MLTVGGPRVVRASAACLVGAVALVWLQARTTGAQLPALDAHTIALMALFGLAYFAGPLSYASVALGVSAGATMLAVGLHEASVVVRRGRTSSDCQLLCLGLMVFVVITAAMTAAARARFGIAQASQSRYALFAMLYMSTTLVLWTIRMSDSLSGLRRVWAVLGATCALTAAMLPADLFIGAVWWAKAENARTAALALGVRVPDFEWIRTLHPDPMKPYEWSALMTFSDRIGDASAERDSQVAAPTTLPSCEGRLVLERVEPARFFRMSGQLAAPADSTVFLQDGAGHTQGMANRLPIAKVPDPTYGQVIAAVWRAVRGGRMHEPAWFGFAQPGVGPPFRAFVMNKGKILCTASVDDPR